MKLANKQLSRSVQSWINRVKRRHPPKVGYHSELRDWVQHVIMEAEKNKEGLQKDLNATQANCTCIRGDL